MELESLALAPADDSRLPPEVEAEIAAMWPDNPAAASLSRRVAAARIRDKVPAQLVAQAVRRAGTVVD